MALGVALLLWVTTRLGDRETWEVPSGILAEIQDPGWMLVGDPSPSEVALRVSGESGALLRFVYAPPPVRIPMDSVESEDMIVQLRPEWVTGHGSGVVVEEIVPSTVRLSLERSVEVSIPITSRLEGALPDSLALVAEPRVSPLFARVAGPESNVDSLETVFLEPLRLDEVTGSGRFDLQLDTAGLGPIALATERAELRLEVDVRRSMQLGPRPVDFHDPDGEFELEPDSVVVIAYGAQAVLGKLDPRLVRLRVVANAQLLRLAMESGADSLFPIEVVGLNKLLSARTQVDRVAVRRRAGS